jgi:histone deacetylase complex regulatory component SIN3
MEPAPVHENKIYTPSAAVPAASNQPTAPYNPQVAGASSIITSMNDGAKGRPQRMPEDFNQAITYVNKIKSRFANQPEIYRSFLETLQNYQKEDKSVSEIYSKVQALFVNAPDLLAEFKLFMPTAYVPPGKPGPSVLCFLYRLFSPQQIKRPCLEGCPLLKQLHPLLLNTIHSQQFNLLPLKRR